MKQIKQILRENAPLWWLLAAVLVIGLFASCGSKKPTAQTEKSTVTHTVDTVYITKTNAVTDTVKIEIVMVKTIKPECDSLVNAEITQVLKKISFQKKSGESQYGFYFDEYNKQLIAYARLDSIHNEYKFKSTLNAEKEYITKEIPKLYTPFLVKILAWTGGVLLIIIIGYFALKSLFPIG